jgi:hypothetical protein
VLGYVEEVETTQLGRSGVDFDHLAGRGRGGLAVFFSDTETVTISTDRHAPEPNLKSNG